MKNTIIFLIIFIFLILITPVIIYILFFYNLKIGNPNDWGVFGDFYGGIINPIMTAITTVLLIYITYLLNKGDKENNKNLVLVQIKQQIIDKLMHYQQLLNSIKSQFIIKTTLIESQRLKINNDFSILSHEEKHDENNITNQSNKNYEILISVKEFHCEMFYKIAEVNTFFKNFNTNYSMLIEEKKISIEILDEIGKKLNDLEELIRKNLNSKNILTPEELPNIEIEISKFISQFA